LLNHRNGTQRLFERRQSARHGAAAAAAAAASAAAAAAVFAREEDGASKRASLREIAISTAEVHFEAPSSNI